VVVAGAAAVGDKTSLGSTQFLKGVGPMFLSLTYSVILLDDMGCASRKPQFLSS